MSISYQAVQWNRQKKIYDGTLAGGSLLFLLAFVGASLALHPGITAETAILRAFGTLAFFLLHVVLSIGPLCRLSRRFLPLLYNRRHLGVTMFLAALVHGGFSIVQFHAVGVLDPLVSVLVSNGSYDVAASGLAQFPFHPLGFVALLILFVMAATSHDFWLANLTAPVWKTLHFGVYLAYALLVGHVGLGILQQERAGAYSLVLGAGVVWIAALHVLAGWNERRGDRDRSAEASAAEDGWVDVGPVDDIEEGRAVTVFLSGERVAIFRYDGKVSALSNACRHQNGPLGEGKIVDGCVVCPWHGYQYRPENGASPPPFTEKVPTFRVAVREGRVWVDPAPLPPGTPVEPASIQGGAAASGTSSSDEFYIGWELRASPAFGGRARRSAVLLLVMAPLVALLLAASQSPFDHANFEFGNVRDFEGVVRMLPHPALEVETPTGGLDHWLLVAFGKHGADALVADLEGQRVHLRGTLAYRGDGPGPGLRTMVEIEDGSVSTAGASGTDMPRISVGRHTLRGEIVDSKCWLGVMKPGRGKAHRACASLCIRGGIPPLLAVQKDGEVVRQLLLLGPGGEEVNEKILYAVGEPVEISGEVFVAGDVWTLHADLDTLVRLGAES